MDQAALLREKMQQQQTTVCKTIAVVSGKGGVGKSNFTTNFALALAQQNHRVLIVDMDIGMGNIHILLGKTARNSLTNYLQGECSIQEIIHQDEKNLDFIAGGSGMSSLLQWSDFMFERLIFAFNELQKNYDFILFDMGAGATEWSLQFMMSVHHIVVVSTTEPTSITDAYSMMKYIHMKDEEKDFYLVCNRALSKDDGLLTLERLKTTMSRFLAKEVLELGMIPEDLQVRKAINQQIPYKKRYPTCQASKAMDGIVERYLTNDLNNPIQLTQENQFISKLRGLFSKRRS
ncbi:MinD/ParA family protein [Kurthia gibsonii]|uniref:MinD/ParA family protein n=1 Tax=Kurthia gibsonii TaxID=33946 RepID=UPI002DBBB0F1|nr:MinD/ParA family protein [Kurthia gibsonii]MEB7771778.1 MinD/ParA family protein [Kurthia gibsonii]